MIDSSVASTSARGTLFIHTCTRALAAPVEWLLADVLGESVNLDWRAQPIAPSLIRTELNWYGRAGNAAAIASGLRGLPQIRFEITEHTTTGFDQRISFTPTLGIFRADLDALGNLVVGENQLRRLLNENPEDGQQNLQALLGTQWDLELEPFRLAADGESVRWFNRVG